jgi:hypothetical protein
MRVPEVIFNETPSLGAPINTDASNRVAIVGEFTRGPINTVLLSEFRDFARIYGYDTGIANLSFQAAYDQGAREFGIKRVIGRSQSPKVDLYVGGVATKANTLTVNLKFVGQPVSTTTSFIETFIAAEGSYTGTVDKRYLFKVTQGPITLNATYNEETSASTITTSIANAEKIVIGSKIASTDSGVLTLPTTTTVTGVNPLTGVVTLSAPLVATVAGYGGFTLTNKATLKWVALSIDQYPFLYNIPTVNWGNDSADVPTYVDTLSATITGGVIGTALDLTTDAGIVKLIAEGISLKFGTTGIPIELYPGDSFTVRANSAEYYIPIAEGATASDVINNIQDITGGVSPIGIVDRLPSEAGARIYLSEDIVGQPLEFFDLEDPDRVTISSGYSLWIDLNEPDGQVVTTGSATSGGVTLTVADATNIAIDSIVVGTSIIQGTTVINKVGNVLTLSDPVSANIVSGTVTFNNLNGINFSNYGPLNKTGFSSTSNSARNAFLTLYSADGYPLVRFTALSPGQWGNNLSISVNSTGSSKFSVTIEDANTNTNDKQVESFNVDLLRDVASDGTINSIGSSYVRADYIPVTTGSNLFPAQIVTRTPQRLAPANPFITSVTDIRNPLYVGNAKLSGLFLKKGYDGPLPTEEDYIAAIKSLAEERVNFIVVASELGAMPAVRQAQLSVANNSGELEGRKLAILTSTRNLTPGLARTETAGINTERGVYIGGWGTYGGGSNIGRFTVPLAAFYAGKLAAIPENISPAARTSAGSIQGIIEADTDGYRSISAKQLFIDAKVDLIAIDPALSGYFVVQGRTMTDTIGKNQISIVRVNDKIRKDIFFNLQSYKGEPNTRTIRTKIAAAISAYMNLQTRSNFIVSYDQPQIDESNNPAEAYYSGILNIALSYRPTAPIERIVVTLTRDVSGNVSLS